MWSPLLRSLLRRALHVLIGLGIREVARHGRDAARGADERDGDERPTIIDLDPVEPDRPLDHFSQPARRAVARAAGLHGGVGVSSEALLLAVLDADRSSAERLARAGTDLGTLRSDLDETVASLDDRRGVTPDAQRALREAEERASVRARGRVEPRDLLEALLAPDGRLAGVVAEHTARTLGPGPEHDG